MVRVARVLPGSIADELGIVRGTELIAPKGGTTLQAGDHVYIFCKSEDLPLVKLMFGRQETED